MIDWTQKSEIKNYGIRNKNGIRARELLIALFLLLPITGSLIFHLWVRGQITNTGYEIQKLSAHEEKLTRELEKLKVKEARLQSPERVDYIARNWLGMAPLRPDQILSPQTPAQTDRSIMALADH